MTALAEQETEAPTNTARPLLLTVFGVLVISLPIIGHGCHAGDHDDELSVPLVEEKISHR